MRAARALLGWSQKDLAKKSQFSEMTIKNIESGKTDPRVSTMEFICAALEQGGVSFLGDNETKGGGIGVRLRKTREQQNDLRIK